MEFNGFVRELLSDMVDFVISHSLELFLTCTKPQKA